MTESRHVRQNKRIDHISQDLPNRLRIYSKNSIKIKHRDPKHNDSMHIIFIIIHVYLWIYIYIYI